MSIITLALNKPEQLLFEQFKQNMLGIDATRHKALELAKLIAHTLRLLAPNLATQLEQMRTNDDIIAISISNLAKLNNNDVNHVRVAKYISLGLSFLLGEPFQYYEQEPKEIVSEIRPKPHLKNTQSSGGLLAFDWHTDESCFPVRFRATWLCLYGIYNPNNVLTKIAPIDQILKHLSNSDKAILMSKRYKIELPKSFKVESSRYTPPVSVLRINGDGHYEIAVRTNDIIPSDPKDTEAMAAIQKIIRASELSMSKFCIDDGSCLIFNNNRSLHSRDAIAGERIVLRTYARPSLDHLRKHAEEIQPNIFAAKDLIDFYR